MGAGSLALCHLVTRGLGEGEESPKELPGKLREGQADRPAAWDAGCPRAGVGMATRRAVPAGTSSLCGGVGWGAVA